jgi:hypothetical protein
MSKQNQVLNTEIRRNIQCKIVKQIQCKIVKQISEVDILLMQLSLNKKFPRFHHCQPQHTELQKSMYLAQETKLLSLTGVLLQLIKQLLFLQLIKQ